MGKRAWTWCSWFAGLWVALFALTQAADAGALAEFKLPTVGVGARDLFGIQTSLDGDRVLVGAHEYYSAGPGAAYIYERNGTSWQLTATLRASGGSAQDGFGYDVSLNGGQAIIGSVWDAAPAYKSGSAYIFERVGTTWTQKAKLVASDGTADAIFGHGVAIDGNYAVVGAPGAHNAQGNDAGAAYVFEKIGGTWKQVAKLAGSDTAANDYLGSTVSISGDRLIVGAHDNDTHGSSAGAAYVFKRDGSGTWSQEVRLTPSDGAAGDRFGGGVVIDRTRALVAAPGDDDGAANSGSVYVFELDAGGQWQQTAKFTGSDVPPEAQFGQSGHLGLSGDWAVVGAHGNLSFPGASYLFHRNPDGSWTEQEKLTPSDGLPGDQFGAGSDTDGRYVVVGAPTQDANGTDSGAAYIFGPIAPPNQPPVANAGPDQTVEQASAAGTQVTLDGSGSSDPDGDALTYTWTWPGGSATGVSPTVTLPLGTTTITFVVNDGLVDSEPDTVEITVEDTTPPILIVPADLTAEQANAAGTVVDTGEALAADVCDAEPTITNDAPEAFPLGETVVTWTATDASGNVATATQKVTIADTMPPEVLSVHATPDVLWPANHKMVDIAITATLADICDAAPGWKVVGVACNEPANGLGDGNTSPDWEIAGDHSLKLRAERSGKGTSRLYAITIEATDASGNAATASCTVAVPHDQKKPGGK